MSFRILNQAPQYLLPDGRVNAGGKLYFYETDLSTPKSTWSNEALSVLNANPVAMDSAGRTTTDVWGDGEYGVVMTDADDVEIWTRNNVRDVDNPGSVIPALVNGEFLTNDGSILAWAPILQVPDPTGSDGYILYSDGINPYWAPAPEIPEPPEPDIIVGANSFQAGVSDDTTKYRTLTGTGSAPATGTQNSSASITFSPAFTTCTHVSVSPTVSSCTPNGGLPQVSTTSVGASGCTVNFYTGDENNGDGSNTITSPITFSWFAVGTIED